MSDLPPDADAEWSEEELLLLRSAERDQPSSRALAATLAAVSLGAASGAATSAAAAASTAVASTGGSTAGATATATAAKWGGALAVSKWVSIVAIGGAVAVTSVALERNASRDTHTRSLAASKTQSPHAQPARVASPVQPQQDEAPAPAVTPAEESSRAAAPATHALHPTAKRKEAPAPPSQPDLSREIALIDGARGALRAGHAQQCLEALDRYDAEHAASGSLQLEAAALRIEALFRLGDRTHAQSLAGAFLSKHPTSPYAARIRSLARGDSSGASSP